MQCGVIMHLRERNNGMVLQGTVAIHQHGYLYASGCRLGRYANCVFALVANKIHIDHGEELLAFDIYLVGSVLIIGHLVLIIMFAFAFGVLFVVFARRKRVSHA